MQKVALNNTISQECKDALTAFRRRTGLSEAAATEFLLWRALEIESAISARIAEISIAPMPVMNNNSLHNTTNNGTRP